MKKALLYSVLFVATVSIISCATSSGVSYEDVSNGKSKCNTCEGKYIPTETSVLVKKETRKMLQSPIIKMAGAQMEKFTYYLVLNENKTFSAIVNIHSTMKYDFRAGTFQTKGDTLNLNYYKNIGSDYLTDKAVIDNNKNEIYFLNTSLAKVTRLKILNEL